MPRFYERPNIDLAEPLPFGSVKYRCLDFALFGTWRRQPICHHQIGHATVGALFA